MGHFPKWLQLGTGRSQRTQSSRAHCCPLQVTWESAAGGGVWVGPGAVTPMHRQHSQGGRQGTGKRAGTGGAQGGHRKRRRMRMEAEALS